MHTESRNDIMSESSCISSTLSTLRSNSTSLRSLSPTPKPSHADTTTPTAQDGLPLTLDLSPPISDPRTSQSPDHREETKGLSFTLCLENNVYLLVCVKDDKENVFRDFQTATDDEAMPFLCAHGYYLHKDIIKLFEYYKWVEPANNTRGFARLYLGSHNPELKGVWRTLCNDLTIQSLCLIMFIPGRNEALVVFSTISREFGVEIKAPGWALELRGNRGLTVARVGMLKDDLCYKMYSRKEFKSFEK